MFENIISIQVGSNGIRLNRFMLALNFILPHLVFFGTTYVILTIKMENYINPDIAKVDNITQLLTRLLMFFPAFVVFGYLLTVLHTFRQKKIMKFAKVFSKVINFVELDSEMFRSFESWCFNIWAIVQLTFSIGTFVNNSVYAGSNMMVESLMLLTFMNWSMFSAQHVILFYLFSMKFLAVAVKRLEQRMKEGKSDEYSDIMVKFNCIGGIIKEVHVEFDFLISSACTKVMAEILVRVSIKCDLSNSKFIKWFPLFQSSLIILSFNNPSLFVSGGIKQTLSNLAVLISDFILMVSFAIPAMEIRNSSRGILVFLATQSVRDRDQTLSRKMAVFDFKRIEINLTLTSIFEINFQFVFTIMITSFSFLIVILQFELESTRVNQYNVFDMGLKIWVW